MLDYETHRAALDAERTAMLAQWAAEDEADARVKRRLKVATVIGALSVAAIWLAVAIVPQYAPVVATVAVLYTLVVWVAMWAWAIRAVR